ncbi:TetR/AcrR family transcriptional regulator [uncultured Aquimarina sp.]|uniref:TetR/AcrR family transcriptional regulator n=1 Tax=uncultured Aquimarina sp. TaxID=575652 RepID=UPI0026379E27|nr:TetR/AcrR family transcriptional regulator [uncultured Aquimarina sp.]
MGITERRQREKEELKALILDTATRQFSTLGYSKTTIRSIAKEIEYSPRTIYLYFKDKDALLYEISVKAFTLFKKEFESVLSIKKPIDRLKQLNQRYVKFAIEHPAYYDLMFILNEPMQSDQTESGWDIGMSAHQILLDIITDCIKDGYFKNMNAEAVAFSIWSYVHGMVSLKIRNRMKMYPEENRLTLLKESSEIMHEILTMTKV